MNCVDVLFTWTKSSEGYLRENILHWNIIADWKSCVKWALRSMTDFLKPRIQTLKPLYIQHMDTSSVINRDEYSPIINSVLQQSNYVSPGMLQKLFSDELLSIIRNFTASCIIITIITSKTNAKFYRNRNTRVKWHNESRSTARTMDVALLIEYLRLPKWDRMRG
jgi:hypothetical protein